MKHGCHRLFFITSLFLISFSLNAATDPVQPSALDVAQSITKGQSVDEKVRVIVVYKSDKNKYKKIKGASAAADIVGIQSKTASVLSALSEHQPEHVKTFDRLPLTAMSLDQNGIVAALNNPDVEAVFEDIPVPPSLGVSVGRIDADQTYAAGENGAGQTVAVLDTGVANDHPFLGGRVIDEACFSSNYSGVSSLCPNGQETQTGTGAAYPCDDICSHGTHVAGIVAGANETDPIRNIPVNGVASAANIMAVQVFSRFPASSCGGSSECVMSYSSDMIQGLEYVYSQRNNFDIAAVNMSLGGGGYTDKCSSDPINSIITLLKSVGIATVIASGNDGYTNKISYPACATDAISVGATNSSDLVVSFSNSTSWLDLVAPGVSIYSSYYSNSTHSMKWLSGTSMATPHVAGAFAVLRGREGSASVNDMLAALKGTGKSVTDSRNNVVTPLINVYQAADQLRTFATGNLETDEASNLKVYAVKGSGNIAFSETYTITNTGDASVDLVLENISSGVILKDQNNNLITSNLSVEQSSSIQITASLDSSLSHWNTGVYNLNLGLSDSNSSPTKFMDVGIQLNVIPNHDNFEDAINLEMTGGATSVSTGSENTTASKQVGEPNHANDAGGKSVWWKWTPTTSGILTAETQGSSFYTTLAIYTGSTVNGLTLIGENGHASAVEMTSRVITEVSAGTEYFIAVDGDNGATGSIKLALELSNGSDDHDFNRDGMADILLRNLSTGLNWMYKMDGASIIDSHHFNQVSDTNWKVIAIHDFDGNGFSDVLWRNVSSGLIWVWLTENSSVISSKSVTALSDLNWQVKHVGDIDGDGQADIILRHESSGKVWAYLLNNGAIKASKFITTVSDLNWEIVAVSDLDQDGKDDLVWRHVTNGNNWVFFMNGNSIKTSLPLPSVSIASWKIVGSGDFDKDGYMDLLWRDTNSGQNWIWLMQAQNIKQSAGLSRIPDQSWNVAQINDFDGDGKDDILWRNSSTGLNWLYLLDQNNIKQSKAVNQITNMSWQVQK